MLICNVWDFWYSVMGRGGVDGRDGMGVLVSDLVSFDTGIVNDNMMNMDGGCQVSVVVISQI